MDTLKPLLRGLFQGPSVKTGYRRRMLVIGTAFAAALVASPVTSLAASEPSDAPFPSAETGDAPEDQIQALFDLINPVVVTATKDSRRVEDAPNVIMVLTRRDIRNWGYDTLAEAFSHILGFYVVDDHVLPNAGVRGVSGGFHAESSVIKVLMDSAPVSFRSTNGNWLGAELIPLSAVERIEIIRGPVSALYGADAFLGVINIITRQPTGDMADVWVGGNWRQTNTTIGYDADISAGIQRERWDAFLGVRLQQEDRSGLPLPKSSPAPNLPSYAASRDQSAAGPVPSRTGLFRLQYHASENTKLAATAYLSYLERIDEFAGLVQLANGIDLEGRPSQNFTALFQGFANLQVNSKLTEALDATIVATYFFGSPRQSNRLEVGSAFYYMQHSSNFAGVDAFAEVRWAPLPQLTLTGGIEIIYDSETLPSNLGIAKVSVGNTLPGQISPDFSMLQGELAVYNPALYLQALWTLHPRYFTLAAGVRYDYHSIYKGQPSARLGIVSQPLEKLHVKVLYGGAFKAPSALLLYAVPAAAGDITGNPSLAPQRVNTFELEVSRMFWDFLTVSSGLAYSILNNMAEFTQQGAYELAANVASVNSLSWESRLRLVKPDDVEAYATLELNYTRISSTQGGYAEQVTGSLNTIYPPLQVHAGIIKWFPEFFVRGMLDVTYVSSRTSSNANALAHGSSYQLGSYIDLSAGLATVGLKLLNSKSSTFSVVARNLLSESAADAGYLGVDYPRLPRSLFLYMNQEI